MFALAAILAGCGGSSSDDRQRDINTDFTELEPTKSSCSIESIFGPIFGTVLVEYLAIDFPATFVDIVPEYSTNNGVTFFPATEGNGGDGDIVLSATQFGATHFFAWDTLADLPQTILASSDAIVFRITTIELSTTSGPLFGTPCTSNVFNVFNTPAVIDLGSLSTGLAQIDQTIPVILTNAIPSNRPTSVVVDIVYDSSLVTIKNAFAGPAAPVGSTVTFALISPGRVQVRVDSSGPPFPDGEIITLVADTACLAPRALPASSAIICSMPMAFDQLNNEVAITCGSPGATAIIDNSSIMSLPTDLILALGQPTEMVPLTYTNGVPSVNADRLTFVITYDPAVVELVGFNPGPALDAAAIITFTPGAGTATFDIANPAGFPFADGVLGFVLVDVTATTAATSFLTVGNVVLGTSGVCPVVSGLFTSPVVNIMVTDARMIRTLIPVSALGSRGTPALVPGSDIARNPKGNFTPLNTGQFNTNTSLRSGGNPVIFFAMGGMPFQIVLEAGWSAPPLSTNVAPATNTDGTTTYMVLSGAAFVSVSPDGLLTPTGANGCAVIEATFTPNLTLAFGAPMTTAFAACVDLGGIDGLTRAGGTLPVGNLDADIPGMPLGDPIPGVGGSFTETVYVNTGATPIGAYQVQTNWNVARLAVDGAMGNNGYDGSSIAGLAGPTVVNITTVPGQATANHFTVSMAHSGIFDIWTIHFDVLSSGTSNLDHLIVTLVSSAVPPVAIGPPTPRPAPEASAAVIVFP